MVVAGFVAPYLLDTTTRFVEAAARLPSVRLALITAEPEDRLPHGLRGRLAGHWRIDDPPERKWAAGTVYLRGQGVGRVLAIHGLDALPPQVSDLIVDSRLPGPGQPSSGSYEGDGYLTVRHPDTVAVTSALKQLLATVRVELGPW